MNDFKAKNHYLPRSYLRPWESDGKVWTYKLLVEHPNTPIWKRFSTKSVARHAHLYTRVLAGGETDEFERWLECEFETPAQEPLRKAISGAHLSNDDWRRLIRFAATQDVRTPSRMIEFLERQRSTMPAIVQSTLAEVTSGEYSRSQSALTPPALNASRFPIRVTTERNGSARGGKLKIETVVGRQSWLFSAEYLLTNTIRVLEGHRWTVLRAPAGLRWLTSDAPVVRLNWYSDGKYDLRGGWGSPKTEILFPLDPFHLMYTMVPVPEQSRRSPPLHRNTIVPVETARWFQRFTIEHAHRFIFALAQDESVQAQRPRLVDAVECRREKKQWDDWHEEQSRVERSLHDR